MRGRFRLMDQVRVGSLMLNDGKANERQVISSRLLRFLTLLDRDVEMIIRPKARRRAAGTLSVLVG